MNLTRFENENNSVDVSIIIVNYNTRELLRECLCSIRECKVSKEIIVVDNASTDSSVEMLTRDFPDVMIIRNSQNDRFAKPNNQAMRKAGGRYIFLLNSDTVLMPDSLSVLLKYMDKNGRVGMCAPQLLYPDGSIQPSCRGFVNLWTHFCDMSALDRLFPRSILFAKSEMRYFNHKSLKEVDHVMAAALLIRRQVIEQVGMFDENLSINYNDLDLSLRVHQHNWKVIYNPEAQVIHHHGKTTNMMNKNFELFDELYKNVFYYFHKHYGRWSVVFYKLFMIFGFSLRTVYWSVRFMFDQSAKTKYYLKFSLRSVFTALCFWKTE
ncbi:MAG: hypothetical protein C0417_08710 [Chlorobiaceae bacterium]|nr:hypothetical protein [Chlorobiaceae bacterium]